MADTQWPPRSPHEALLASPSGRKKLRMLQDRTSPSPSPRKRPAATPTFRERARQLIESESPTKALEEDEDDEETLELKLQAIEARLKLKRLQQAKVKATIGSSDVETSPRKGLSAEAQARLAARRLQHTEERLRRGRSQPDLQVPLSPPPKRNAPEEPRSPGRVLLGIDKGLKGRDVSLRRAPSLRSGSTSAQPQGVDARLDRRKQGIIRSESTPTLRAVAASKTYSEKLAEIRTTDRAHEERAERLRQTRNKGFTIDEKEIAEFKNAPTLNQGLLVREAPREFTREEVLQSYNHNSNIQSDRRKVPDSQNKPISRATTRSRPPSSQASDSDIQSTRPPSRSKPESAADNDASQFESYSACHLSKRILPHNFLTRQFSGKETFTIADLLKVVKSPEYDPPDVDTDWILLATIASKSNPKNHKDDTSSSNKRRSEDGPKKFMAFTLTDLKYELTLYLFGSAFDHFWKLTPGTVVAVLNPSIMPPRAHLAESGNFSIMVNSSDDVILEIGTGRDLGWCKSLKRDGHPCGQWVDLRHTEFCEYHVDAQVKKTKSSRMEVNTMTAPFAPGGRAGSGYRGWGRGGRGRDDGLRKEGQQHDWETHSNYWIASTGNSGRSSASLIDDNDIDPDAFHRGSNKDERIRRRLAEQEKERKIAKELGKHGDGIGGEYFRLKHGDVPEGSDSMDVDAPDPVNAESLGLLGGTADNARLSPIKRKRALNSGSSTASAVGWGGAFKRGLPEPSVGRAKAEEPIKKKTRFVTAKGIREAGRESFGGEMVSASSNQHDAADEDDDELEIIGGKSS